MHLILAKQAVTFQSTDKSIIIQAQTYVQTFIHTYVSIIITALVPKCNEY